MGPEWWVLYRSTHGTKSPTSKLLPQGASGAAELTAAEFRRFLGGFAFCNISAAICTSSKSADYGHYFLMHQKIPLGVEATNSSTRANSEVVLSSDYETTLQPASGPRDASGLEINMHRSLRITSLQPAISIHLSKTSLRHQARCSGNAELLSGRANSGVLRRMLRSQRK